ncbi:MAG: hypothetical protein KF791_00310 [Verrucomicrobiae bacterium]|nr:hypothetical protein [Verrucomicrobiae bacterium]
MKPTLLCLILAVGLVSGCTTPPTGAGKGRYAAVEVDGFSRDAVRLAIAQVFEREGYKLVNEKNNALTYEKAASTGQNVLWGNLERGVWERVIISITRLREGDFFLVSLDAYRINNHGDAVLEDAKKMGFAMQSKYQDLLEQVRKLLAPLPMAAAPHVPVTRPVPHVIRSPS